MEESTSANSPEKVMNRIGWFTHLKIIYEDAKKQYGKDNGVPKPAFLAHLLSYYSVILNISIQNLEIAFKAISKLCQGNPRCRIIFISDLCAD